MVSSHHAVRPWLARTPLSMVSSHHAVRPWLARTPLSMVSSHHAVRPWLARAPLSVTIISARCCSCLIHSSSGNYKDYVAFGCFHARRLLWRAETILSWPKFSSFFFFFLLFCEIDANHFFYWMIMNDLESTCACINEIFSYQFIH